MAKKSILIMAGGTGGHIFSSGITRTLCALAFTEDMAGVEVSRD